MQLNKGLDIGRWGISETLHTHSILCFLYRVRHMYIFRNPINHRLPYIIVLFLNFLLQTYISLFQYGHSAIQLPLTIIHCLIRTRQAITSTFLEHFLTCWPNLCFLNVKEEIYSSMYVIIHIGTLYQHQKLICSMMKSV